MTQHKHTREKTRLEAFAQPPAQIILLIFVLVAALQFPIGIVIQKVSFVWGIIANELGVMLLLPLIVLKLSGQSPKNLLPFGKTNRRYLLASICLILGVAIIIFYLRVVSEMLAPLNDTLRMALSQTLTVYGPLDTFLKLLLLCVLAPICEEIFFRGFIQRTFSRHVGKTFAILITAVFFAFMHPSTWHPHLYFILGLTLSWISAKTRTLRTPILCHMINNTFVLMVQQYGLGFPIGGVGVWIDIVAIFASSSLIVLGIFMLQKSRRHG